MEPKITVLLVELVHTFQFHKIKLFTLIHIHDEFFILHLRINPATMGYISVVIPPVKVNRAEEGIGNPEYILLWF